MTVFAEYSRYYDLLYRDKDYPEEADWVCGLLAAYAPEAATLLDLGCGTGAHAARFVERGLDVVGIDRSASMLERAEQRRRELAEPLAQRLELIHADLRGLDLGRTVDVVVSLFHVISYQIETEDLRAAFGVARHHLGPGGIFVFDCWYGPAVLSQRPERRIKRLDDDVLRVTRRATPVLHPNRNRVDVHYRVRIEETATNTAEELEEVHRVRYLFLPEIELLLSLSGLELLEARRWMSDDPPSEDSWSVCCLARAVD